ncbi:MAG: hypothetical protein CM15mP96_2610 [Gammaproteobacteria bacterium]|nr:MAG: hypothetical protein CM15mP96_2610 [Gammaproteobacteria bacterium]
MIGLLGSDAYIITCLGDDLFADATLENYKNHLVNVDFVQEFQDRVELPQFGLIQREKIE